MIGNWIINKQIVVSSNTVVIINYWKMDGSVIWFDNRVGVETLYRLMGELGVKPDHEVITLVSW